MNISPDNLLRIGLVVGGLLVGTGGTLGTQWFTGAAPAKAPVVVEADYLEIRIPFDKLKLDRVKGGAK